MLAPNKASARTVTNRPNLLLIVIDSARAANLSCYGYSRPTTPNIDALAQEGTLFEQAISVGCWTLPVHASMFTGAYPSTHGLNSSSMALPRGGTTLAGDLSRHGYETVCFSNNPYISAATGLAQGFDTVVDLWEITRPRGIKRTRASRLIKRLETMLPWSRPAIWMVQQSQRAWALFKRRPEQTRDSGAKRTVSEIKRWLTSRDPSVPFFAFINFMEVHEPYRPPAPYDRQFLPAGVKPADVYRLLADKSARSRDPAASQARREVLRSLYDGGLRYLDQQLGELFDSLRSLGILDRTVVVVTSDHGDSLGEHDEFGHRKVLYEQLVRVPLVVRYPERFPAGARSPAHVQLVDLHPTLLELAGAHGHSSSPGVFSLTESLGQGRREFTVAENTAPKSLDFVLARMLRGDRYKFLWKSDGRHELYDLLEDPAESVNLVATHPEIAAELEEKLNAWHASLSAQENSAESAEYDELVMSRLRELGYVD